MAENSIPRHVAIIMDGNGRWAVARRIPKIAGHRQGASSVREVIDAAREVGVRILTLYTFSTENWKRPKAEVDGLFRLLEEYLDKETAELIKNNIRFFVTGDIGQLPEKLRAKLLKTMESTASNTAFTLNLALNYGSRMEIASAARQIAADAAAGRIKPSDVNEQLFSSYLYTKELPDPDLLIRTSGECRVSNFLLWQIAYSELYIAKKNWPDFKNADFKKAIKEYQRRERRFGG